MNRGASLDELLAAEKIENADFTQRELPGGLSFAGRALISCLFDGAALSRRGLHSAAALERCSFRGADLPDAAFDEAELADCDFTGAKLGGARFVRAKLARVSLDGVDMRRAFFHKSEFSECEWNCANLSEATFMEAASKLPDFAGNEMEKTLFIGCALDGAKLAKARAPMLVLQKCSCRKITAEDVRLDADSRNGDGFHRIELRAMRPRPRRLHRQQYDEMLVCGLGFDCGALRARRARARGSLRRAARKGEFRGGRPLLCGPLARETSRWRISPTRRLRARALSTART